MRGGRRDLISSSSHRVMPSGCTPDEARACVLWCHSEGQPADGSKDVPACPLCGAERVPVFQVRQPAHPRRASPPLTAAAPPQIMPQAIHLLRMGAVAEALKVAPLDFGVVVVYVCSASCSPPASDEWGDFAREVAWVQTMGADRLSAEEEAEAAAAAEAAAVRDASV